MLGSKNRDYKTSTRLTTARIVVHATRIKELVSQGIPKIEASKMAYREIINGKLTEAVHRQVEKLKTVDKGELK